MGCKLINNINVDDCSVDNLCEVAFKYLVDKGVIKRKCGMEKVHNGMEQYPDSFEMAKEITAQDLALLLRDFKNMTEEEYYKYFMSPTSE